MDKKRRQKLLAEATEYVEEHGDLVGENWVATLFQFDQVKVKDMITEIAQLARKHKITNQDSAVVMAILFRASMDAMIGHEVDLDSDIFNFKAVLEMLDELGMRVRISNGTDRDQEPKH